MRDFRPIYVSIGKYLDNFYVSLNSDLDCFEFKITNAINNISSPVRSQLRGEDNV